MKHKKDAVVSFLIIFVLVVMVIGAVVKIVQLATPKASGQITPVAAAIEAPRFTHQQITWISALEWCESKAINTAVNWYDKDGTPSYYAFQFKPDTLKRYGVKYGLIPKDVTDAEIMEMLKDYALVRSVVEFMVEDPSVKWRNEFPDCVRNKIGMPPIIKKINEK